MTRTYRLHTADVANGLVDFNDLVYYQLQSKDDYTILFKEGSGHFIVAYKPTLHEEFDSIEWEHGHYFDDVVSAVHFFESATSDVYRLIRNNGGLSTKTMRVILDTGLEAIEQEIISSDSSLVEIIDIAQSFIRDNPDIIDEDVYDELEGLLG